jgi:hypothetical protein
MTVQYWCSVIGPSLSALPIKTALTKIWGTSQLAVDLGGSYSAAMRPAHPIVGLLVVLIMVEVSLFILGSGSSLSTIEHPVLVGFLFYIPALLVGGLLLIHQQWVAMISVIYSTIALALDLATIVQESNQSSPHSVVLILTVLSSLVNLLILIFGGRCAISFKPDKQPPAGQLPNVQSPAPS